MEAALRKEVPLDLEQINTELEHASPQAVMRWAVAHFEGRLALSSSFGAQSAVMLHLASKVAPGIPVILIDTGYLFPETYRFAHELESRLDLNLQVVRPRLSAAHQEAVYGRRWEQEGDELQAYLFMNKVEPMERALNDLGADAWMAGLRADQTDHRKSLRKVALQNGRIKLHPILDWDDETVDAYLKMHDLPVHPLVQQGYRSIGDTHSTFRVREGADARDGRRLGEKRECGLHLNLTEAQNRSLKSSGL